MLVCEAASHVHVNVKKIYISVTSCTTMTCNSAVIVDSKTISHYALDPLEALQGPLEVPRAHF